MTSSLSPAPRWSQFQRAVPVGRVDHVSALGVQSVGPAAALGDVCAIVSDEGSSIHAEVIAVSEHRLTLMPYGDATGLTAGHLVLPLSGRPSLRVSSAMLGKVVDAFGQELGVIPGATPKVPNGADERLMPLTPKPINAMKRPPIRRLLRTGVRVIDALMPIGMGQRMGIFAGSGVGKSSLMGMLAQNLDADINVIALIGERGREVRDFIEHRLSPEVAARTVVVVSTAEEPAVVRARAAHAALAVAEFFREAGQQVMLLMDSVTRYAMARREVDLAAGQPATARGYTPSVFSAIPALCERCGEVEGQGSITAIMTVLVEGDDVHEPIADTLRATLDGHIVLSRALANAGHYPAVDVLHSLSRLDGVLLTAAQRQASQTLRGWLDVHARQRDMVDMGLYKSGSNPLLDRALTLWPDLQAFLSQSLNEPMDGAALWAQVEAMLSRAEASSMEATA